MSDSSPTDNGSRLVLHTRVVTGAGGGPDKTILNSHRFLADSGYPMACAYMRPPGDPGFAELERRAERWGSPLIAVDDHGPFDRRLPARFERICRERQPAIWHGHDYKSNLLGLLLRRKYPMRLVTTVHGWVKRTWKTPLYYAIDRFCLRRYDEVVCVSEDLYRDCLGLGIPPDRCWHIPNAIDTDEYVRTESIAEAKRRLGVPTDRLLIGAVGRLSKEKGFDLLIDAVSRLIAEGVDVELRIAGEGDDEARLAQRIAQVGHPDRIRLIGYCSDTLGFYQAMDVFALSSIREGLPNVLLEAMALELPVLATEVAGIPKLIRNDDNGLLVAPGSVDAIFAGLRRLLDDDALRGRLGSRGRVTIEENHSFRRRMDRMKDVYDKALGRA